MTPSEELVFQIIRAAVYQERIKESERV